MTRELISGVDVGRDQALLEPSPDVFGGATADLELFAHLRFQSSELHRVQMVEGEIREISLDLCHSEAVGDRERRSRASRARSAA